MHCRCYFQDWGKMTTLSFKNGFLGK
jgi:hypothetical protein